LAVHRRPVAKVVPTLPGGESGIAVPGWRLLLRGQPLPLVHARVSRVDRPGAACALLPPHRPSWADDGSRGPQTAEDLPAPRHDQGMVGPAGSPGDVRGDAARLGDLPTRMDLAAHAAVPARGTIHRGGTDLRAVHPHPGQCRAT